MLTYLCFVFKKEKGRKWEALEKRLKKGRKEDGKRACERGKKFFPLFLEKRTKKKRKSLYYLRGVLRGRTVRAGVPSQLAHAMGEARNACRFFFFMKL